MNATTISALAARLIVEQGFADYGAAKRKAAQQLGLERGPLPRNEEIEIALVEYLTAFADDQHWACIREMRSAALKLMKALSQLPLTLVGPVASGIATEHFPIQIECDSDDEKSVNIALINAGFDAEAFEVGKAKAVCYRFEAFDWPFELFIATEHASRAKEAVIGAFTLGARLDRAALVQAIENRRDDEL
jgi:hypothetical protein